ncbi:MAG TPA: hypothetical protein VGD71_02960 [Kribbella sp.]
MPRPTDWDSIGLSADPTPGDPDQINQLAGIFSHLGGKAREIYNAIETVMSTADDSVFSGSAADALRGKVDNRLRGHVEDVAWAFENSAAAIRDWYSVVVDQQAKADGALAAGRGLAADDPERQRQADIATQAGNYQQEQGQTVANRIESVSHISLPISACKIFWEAFQWLAIILIIPALIFGGPIALLALGVNFALFIKTAVDFANGDAQFLDLFLAGLGLIAPTTKALPIFSLLKGIGQIAIGGVKALVQGVRTLFSRDFLLDFLLPGLLKLPALASVGLRETGLFVVTGLRQIPAFTGGIFHSGVQFALNGITRFPGLVQGLPGVVGRGFSFVGQGVRTGARVTWNFAAQSLGGTRWLRLLLPVDAGEIRAFGFWGAVRIGLVDRGLLGRFRFGAPLTGTVGRTISAAPINPPAVNLGHLDGFNSLATASNPPPIHLGGLNVGDTIGNRAGLGFNASRQLDGLEGIHLTDLTQVRSGDLGISVATGADLATNLHPSGLHLPANAGAPGVVHAASIGTPTPGLAGVPGSGVDVIGPAGRAGNPFPTGVPVSPGAGVRIGDQTMHGLVANQVRLNLDELIQTPAAQHMVAPTGLQTAAPTVQHPVVPTQAIAQAPVVEPARIGTPPGGYRTADQLTTSPVQAAAPPVPLPSERWAAALQLVETRPSAPSLAGIDGSVASAGRPGPADHAFAGAPGNDVARGIGSGPSDRLAALDTAIGQKRPTLEQIQEMWTWRDQQVTSVLGPVDSGLRGAWRELQLARYDLYRARQSLPDPGIASTSTGPASSALEAKKIVDVTEQRLLDKYQQVVAHGGDPQAIEHQLDAISQQRATIGSGGLAGGSEGVPLPAPALQPPPGMQPAHGVLPPNGVQAAHGAAGPGAAGDLVPPPVTVRRDLPLTGIRNHPDVFVRIERTGNVTSHQLFNGGAAGRLDPLPNGELRFTNSANGRTFRFDQQGNLIDQGTRLTAADGALGAADRIVVRPPGGGMHLSDLNGNALPDQVTVRELDSGGVRIIHENGLSERYNPRGRYQGDSIAIADSNHLRGQWYVERTGQGDGLRIVDLNGTARPGATPEPIPNGRVLIHDDAAGFTWYGRDGMPEATGIQLVDPAGPADRFVVQATGNGAPTVAGRAGDPLPGQVDVLHGGGYRIQLDNGNTRYDATGNHLADGLGLTRGDGLTGYLERGADETRWLDHAFQPAPDRVVQVDAATGEISIGRPGGGHEIFDQRGQFVREVTPLDPHAIGPNGSQVIRLPDNTVQWVDAAGQRIELPNLVTMRQDGSVRIEVNLPGSPRHGEFHEFTPGGQVSQEGFNVLRDGHPTEFMYVVDRSGDAPTWTRTTRAGELSGTGAFQHGSVDLSGAANGQIRLLSSTGKPVEVFERRLLPDGSVLDSFRRTDTVGFGYLNRRTTWVTYHADGRLTGSGTRHFDTAGSGWRDVNNAGHTIREHRDGLQKYQGSTGHVLAYRRNDGSWQWHRYDGHGVEVAHGDRVLERIGDGWTDTVTRQVDGALVTEVAQQKWGSWHLPETAGHYQEFTLTKGPDGTLERLGTWEQQSKHGKDSGAGQKLSDTAFLKITRHGEQRPPVWIRESPIVGATPPRGAIAHLADDNRFQMFRWERTGDGPAHGFRYVAMDGAAIDVSAQGNFVRSTGKLLDGTTLKVGDHARPPAVPHQHPQAVPWEAGGQRGWRVPLEGDPAGKVWQDVVAGPGHDRQVVREGMPGGVVREYPDPAVRAVWIERDAHGFLTGMSYRVPDPGLPEERFIVAGGAADSSRWTWHEVDAQGQTIAGRGGDRQFFRGSTDTSLSWDDSFRDFGPDGNLIRDRRMLDNGRYVDAWRLDGGEWRSAVFDKFGTRLPGEDLVRLWGSGGDWQRGWVAGAEHFRDVKPAVGNVPEQVVREVPVHLEGGPLRVREYHQDAQGLSEYGRWKEFDHGAVVRERQLSGTNFLETDAWRGQWKLYDQQGALIGERADNGLVFELRDGKLHLTGNEYDFRGPLTEIRGWGRRVREAQRMPWLLHTDWTGGIGSTILPVGNPALREARYAPVWRTVAQKAALEFGQEFVLEFAANLIVNAIVAEAQNKPFTGNDALKALMNAGVSSTIKTGFGTALNETGLGGRLRDLRLGMANIDGGKHWNRRPFNHDKTWANEWAGNETATRWRGGTYDFSFNLGTTVLAGWVNGTMNAAIFGVSNANGTSVKLSGWEAMADGGINALASLTSGISTALVKNIAASISGSRSFHRQGFADFWTQLPFKIFEKSIQGVFITSAYRASINPSWYQVPYQVPVPAPVSGLVLPASSNGQ